MLLDFKHARNMEGRTEVPQPESLSLRKLRVSESRKHGLSEQKAAKQLQNLAQVPTHTCTHKAACTLCGCAGQYIATLLAPEWLGSPWNVLQPSAA